MSGWVGGEKTHGTFTLQGNIVPDCESCFFHPRQTSTVFFLYYYDITMSKIHYVFC